VTDEAMTTKILGIHADGDIRDKTLCQIVITSDDGSMADQSVQYYMEHLES
jgi:thioredoxin reductase